MVESMRCMRKSALIVVLVVLLPALSTSPSADAQTIPWSEPVNVSNTPGGSWFPDLAIDNVGNVHVVWSETVIPEVGLGGMRLQELEESVHYAVWDGHDWSEPNDLVPVDPNIVRNALAVDGFDNLYFAFRYPLFGSTGYYLKQAPTGQAWSAAAWSMPRRVDVKGNPYMADLAIDSHGVMHFIVDDTGDAESAICLGGCADLYYRRSEDQGQTWSHPANLSRSAVGVSREQIEIDSSDVIHITWDEGWDRISGVGDAVSGSYSFSTDGGGTWSPVKSVTYPDSTVAQLTVGSDGEGGVMLVWRATSTDEIYYQWSADGGHSWEDPATIPRVFARLWTTPFDMYDMAADSAGDIHLLMVGRQSQEKDALLGIYHLVWDGQEWSFPTTIFGEWGFFPEYPKIAIHEGNQLHVVWFTREGSEWDDEANREVWYSRTQSAAPQQPVTPVPTPTPVPPIPTPMPAPTATPYPTVSLENSGLPDGLHTDNDDVYRLAVALLPVALGVLILIAVRLRWFGRIGR